MMDDLKGKIVVITGKVSLMISNRDISIENVLIYLCIIVTCFHSCVTKNKSKPVTFQ